MARTSAGRMPAVGCWSLAVVAFLTFFPMSRTLELCGAREACRVVEYHPVISDEQLRALEQSSGSHAPINELDYGDGLAKEEATAFPYEETSYTIESQQLCECAGGLGCPHENDTDDQRSVRLDNFAELKLCASKQQLPVCRDFRRPVLRLFKEADANGNQPQVTVSPSRYVQASIWCNCQSGHFGRSRNVEIWKNGQQHAVPYVCSRHSR